MKLLKVDTVDEARSKLLECCKRIMPQIDVFKFGPLYYSVIWNSRV